MKDFYAILEVSPAASAGVIRASYLELSKRYHPDRNARGAEMAKSINEAYSTLKDPKKREAYDIALQNWNARRNPVPEPEPVDYGGQIHNLEQVFEQAIRDGAHKAASALADTVSDRLINDLFRNFGGRR